MLPIIFCCRYRFHYHSNRIWPSICRCNQKCPQKYKKSFIRCYQKPQIAFISTRAPPTSSHTHASPDQNRMSLVRQNLLFHILSTDTHSNMNMIYHNIRPHLNILPAFAYVGLATEKEVKHKYLNS